MGPEKFYRQMVLAKVPMTMKKAADVVYLYRRKFAKIPDLWSEMEMFIHRSMDPKCMLIRGPLVFLHERVTLPNGMSVIYPGLKIEDWSRYVFRDRRARNGESWIKLWGGAITENLVQALARIVLTRAELLLARSGLRAALQVHDELVYVVPENHVGAVERALRLVLTAPVDFMPDLPVAVEVGVGDSYGEAK